MRSRARHAAPPRPRGCDLVGAPGARATPAAAAAAGPSLPAASPPSAPRRRPPSLAMRGGLLLPCLAAALALLLLPGGPATATAAAASSATAYSLPCERSGYCSLGKTKPYMGEVDSSLGLRAALAARSYRREVILMSSDSERMLPAMMAVQNLLRLGLEHVLMMSSSGGDCVRVAGAVPTAGCVWLDFELPIFGADREFVVPAIPMWHNRYRLAARVVRLGYNVFLTDTDVIFFDDPYVYFKSPPFANYTVINQPETLYDQADYAVESEPNGGVLYIQNASPTGPAAWMLSEVTDRLLRWIEDGFNTTRHVNSLLTWCNYMDQDGLRDAISSVLLGRVFFGVSVKDCRTDEWKEAHASEHQAIVDAVDEELRNAPGGGWGSVHVALPPAMQPVAGSDSADLRQFTMHMPVHQPWNDKWGPWLYPPRRGPLSSAWLAQLKEDCSGCALWPDPEDGSANTVAAAAAVPTEAYLLAPPFLLLNWFARGRLGYWTRALGGPQQVAGHLHYIPGTDAALGKTVARMAVGHYDWALARQVLGPRMYFMHQGSSATPQPFHEGQPGGHAPLSLLALHPALTARLAATNSWTEYSSLLAGLMTAAHALKRIPVWPDPPCSAPWIAEDGPQGATTLPLGIRMEFIPYGRKRSALSCVWLPLLNGPCLLSGRGMLALEFAHWKAQVRMQFAVEPGPHNTIAHLSAAAAADAAFEPAANATPAARIYNLAADEVARAWGPRRTHGQRVLYLMHPLNVTFPPVTEETWGLLDALGDCKATNPRDVYTDLADKPYRVVRKAETGFLPAGLDAAGRLVPAPAVPGYNVPTPRPGAARAGAGAGGADGGGNGTTALSGGAGGAAGNATVVEEEVEDDGRPFRADKGSAATLAAADAAGAASLVAAAAAAAAGGGDAAAAGAAAAADAVTTVTTATAASALDVASAAATAAAAAAQAAVAIANQAAGGAAAATDGAVAAATGSTVTKKKKKKKKSTLAASAVNGADVATAAAAATAADATAATATTLEAAAALASANATAAAGDGTAASTAGAADAATGAAAGLAVARNVIATTDAATVTTAGGDAATAGSQQPQATAAAGSGAADGGGATASGAATSSGATDAAATAAGATAGADTVGVTVDATATADGTAGAATTANAGAVDAADAAGAGAATIVGSASTDAATAAGDATTDAAAGASGAAGAVDAATTSASTTASATSTTATDTGSAADTAAATATAVAAASPSPSPSPTDPGVIATVDGQRVSGAHVVTAAEVAAASGDGPEAEAIRAKALSAVQGMGPFGMAAALKAAEAAGGAAAGGRGTRAGMGGGMGLAGARGGAGGGHGGGAVAGGFQHQQRGGMAGARGQFRGAGGGGAAGGGVMVGGGAGGGRFGGAVGGMAGGGTLRQRMMGAGGVNAGGGGGGVMGGAGGMGGMGGSGGGMRGGVGGGMAGGDMGGGRVGGGGGMMGGGGGMGGGAGGRGGGAVGGGLGSGGMGAGAGGVGGGGADGGGTNAMDAAAMALHAQYAAGQQTQGGAGGARGAAGAAGGSSLSGGGGGTTRVIGAGGGGGTTRILGAGGAGGGALGGGSGLGGGSAGGAGGSNVINRAQWNKLQGLLGGRGTAAQSDLARFQAAVAAAQGRAGLTGGGGGGNRMARAGTRWLLEGRVEQEEQAEEEVVGQAEEVVVLGQGVDSSEVHAGKR